MLFTRIAGIVILVLSLLIISQYSSAFYEFDSAVDEQSKNSNTVSKYNPRASRYSLSILKPISRAEFLSYTETMKLDEPQIAFAELLLDEYRNTFKTRRSELCSPLWQRSAELLASRPNLDELTHAEAHSKLIEDGRKAQSQLVKLEDELFNEIDSFLLEDQLPFLEQVKLQRSRNQLRGFGGLLRVDEVDIIIMMRNLPGMDDIEEAKREALSKTLLEYDRDITPLWKQRYKAALKSTLQIPILKAPLYELSDRAPLEPMEQDELESLDREILKKVGQLNRGHIRPGKRIIALNQQYIKALESVLPRISWDTLQQRYNKTAFYPIFPNPFDANFILDTAIELTDLSTEQRLVIYPLAIDYAISTKQIEDKMKVQYVAMRETLAEFQRKGDQFKSQQEELRKLDAKRQEIAVKSIAQLKDVLLPSQLSELVNILEEFKQKATVAKENRERRLFHS